MIYFSVKEVVDQINLGTSAPEKKKSQGKPLLTN